MTLPPRQHDERVDETARASLSAACDQVHDASPEDAVDGVPAGVVARPGSTQETAEVMRAAAAHGLAVVARGSGTKLTWGRPPARADLLLDLSRLDRVLDHAAGDLVVAAQAGTPLREVQQVVAQAGQRLAVDEVVPGSTVGGTLATASSGPRRLATGTARDLLIGLTVVRPDGVVAKAGGRVVKNVAGYDLGKLVVGSYGTLAVVTEALFRLHPLPAESRFVTVPIPTTSSTTSPTTSPTTSRAPRVAHELAQTVVHSQVVPSAVELDWSREHRSLTVLLEGIPAGVEGRTRTTLDLLGPEATAGAEPPPAFGSLPWPVDATGDERATALKLTFALSGLADVLEAADRSELPLHLRGSAGAGVLHAALPATAEAAAAGAVGAVVARLREVCTRHGGAVVVLDAPAAVKEAVDTWGPVHGLHLMRRVKDQFDPEHRLAPGRFVGGI